MSLYLCVDCGGSKTSAVISDLSGKIIGRATGGPSNFTYLSLQDFTSAVKNTVSDALKASAWSPETIHLPPIGDSPFAAAWFGVSGVDSPSAVAEITPALSTLLGIPIGRRLAVANDTHLLAAPIRFHADVSTAVAVIAGTGSIAVTFRDQNGQLAEVGRVGGWGWMLGDEGGGFHVGRETIRQIVYDYDKGSVGAASFQGSKLTARILEHFGVQDVMDLLTVVHVADPQPTEAPSNIAAYRLLPREKRLSSLPPIVFKAAFEDDDPMALHVLRTCAGILASEIAILLGDGERTVRAQDSVISFGGSLVGIESYRRLILDDLAHKGHIFRYVEFIDDAAATGVVGLAAGFKQNP